MTCVLYSFQHNETFGEFMQYKVQMVPGALVDTKRLVSLLTPPHYKHIPNYRGVPEHWARAGPLPQRVTPWCTNMLDILHKCGFTEVTRIEKIRVAPHTEIIIDPMLECIYTTDTSWSQSSDRRDDSATPVDNLVEANTTLQLGFDDADLRYYTNLFQQTLKRAPTQIELVDLAQSNSEHSRHWFFKGVLQDALGNALLNGRSLFDLVQDTQKHTTKASKSAFCDNASALQGYSIPYLAVDAELLCYTVRPNQLWHPTFTAETHNFPTSVAPFEGATTGVGGRIRDQHAIGRGGLVIAGTAGYCVANLGDLADNTKPLTRAARILIEASNGASDYGNKFGEPIINGFCRTFEQTLALRPDTGSLIDLAGPNQLERIAWHKPIMFSGGVGQVHDAHVHKATPTVGDLVVKLGGPAYRIGLGGGTASSRAHNTAHEDVDRAAVQRGDAAMENKLNRVIRSCIEFGADNPIRSIHDQGAGGTANVTKEIVHPQGATIQLDSVKLGDASLTPLEVWISEYQEQDTVLIRPEARDTLNLFCTREGLPMAVIGEVEDSGRIQVKQHETTLVDLPLKAVVGDGMPRKRYTVAPAPRVSHNHVDTYTISYADTVRAVLKRVFALPSVGSKRFLTNKVDRSVSGLVAQQQCVGPYQTPVADYALVAQSHFGLTGIATANGERPLIGLTNPAAMARMAVGEMLTNLMFVGVRSLSDVRCAGNWMWPSPKSDPHEAHALYTACVAMCDTVKALGIALDGGKDSLSMSYTDHTTGTTTKAPRQLVMSGYAAVPDIRVKVTPDLKGDAGNKLIFVDLGARQMRIQGSALAQTEGEIGHNKVPDLDAPERLKHVFNTMQTLLQKGLILAGHDRSDGGLITTLCEMAMAGNVGMVVELPWSWSRSNPKHDVFTMLFNEELGVVVEVRPDHADDVATQLGGIVLGTVTDHDSVRIRWQDEHGWHAFEERLWTLRKWWERTSYGLEKRQANAEVVAQEWRTLTNPVWRGGQAHLHIADYNTRSRFTCSATTTPLAIPKPLSEPPCVAIFREQGSNGDREMASAFVMAGFRVVDVSVHDLYQQDDPRLDMFRGIAFVGGFSYADVGGSAFGWAKALQETTHVRNALETFRKRPDTFSLGVCNGCQLMARLGWVPEATLERNDSGRFESRFVQVQIRKSPAIMLRGLEKSTLGVWVAHGEGKFSVKRQHDIKEYAPLRYYKYGRGDTATETYPYNPNGSPQGVAALCSPDGRHLAMMPHPERSFLTWQWPVPAPWVPQLPSSDDDKPLSPWFRLFQNAYGWCAE